MALKFFLLPNSTTETQLLRLTETTMPISHNKIYKTDAAGTITPDEDGHATNIAPLDFSITKGVVSIMFTFLLMFFLFKSLADSYAKNGGIASGVGRFFEPIVLYSSR